MKRGKFFIFGDKSGATVHHIDKDIGPIAQFPAAAHSLGFDASFGMAESRRIDKADRVAAHFDPRFEPIPCSPGLGG